MSTKTTNLGLIKPDELDFYDVNVQNSNMDIIDVAISEKADRSEITNTYDDSALRTRVTTVETTLATKANKSELFSKKYSELTGTPTSLPANGGNASTVNGFTVASNVPSGAKFTDTVYTHPSTHPYSMITDVPTSLPANGGNSDTVDGLHMVTMTQTAYNALATKNASTIYYIVG